MESRKILVGGETIKIPEGMNVAGIQEGSRYKIIYSGGGENKMLTEFIEKDTNDRANISPARHPYRPALGDQLAQFPRADNLPFRWMWN